MDEARRRFSGTGASPTPHGMHLAA